MARSAIKIKRPGALRRKAGIKKGRKLTVAKLRSMARSRNARTRRQANFALNARKWKHR